MKRLLIAIFAGALTAAVAVAQDQENAPPPGAPPTPQASTPAPVRPPDTTPATPATRIASGSVIPVELTKSIDAKKAKTGDEVVAKVTQDLKSNNGDIVIAKDTKLMGRVTEAQPRSKEQKESEVGIAFDRAVMKDGGEMQMPMSIQAIVAPPNSNQADASRGNGPDQSSQGGYSNPSSNRPTGMNENTAPPSTASAPSGNGSSVDAQSRPTARPQITGNTQGVIGISNLKLVTTASDPTQGSLVSSEKNNVKLESGTMMLLRVN